MCPSVYKKQGVGAIVYHQPVSEEEKVQAYSALVTCPTGSIRLHSNDPLIKQVLTHTPHINYVLLTHSLNSRYMKHSLPLLMMNVFLMYTMLDIPIPQRKDQHHILSLLRMEI